MKSFQNSNFYSKCKKVVLSAFLILGMVTASEAQVFKLGIKAGPNFANFTGGEIQTKTRTSFHVGAAAELGLTKSFSIAPELLYSSQGADVDEFGDINFDYVSIPVLARIYLIEEKLSLDIGPQFSFLVNDDDLFGSGEEAVENEDFDFALAGGATLNITKSIFVQARYVAGLTEASKDAEVKNSVVQFSVGYNFL